jgi:hypothetical protein
MPPSTEWYEGHEGIRAFLIEKPLTRRWRFLPANANGQLTFGTYMWDEDRAVYVAAGLDLLALRDTKIAKAVAARGGSGLPGPVNREPQRGLLLVG